MMTQQESVRGRARSWPRDLDYQVRRILAAVKRGKDLREVAASPKYQPRAIAAAYLEIHDLSQSDLARELDCSQGHVWGVLHGRYAPTAHRLLRAWRDVVGIPTTRWLAC